MNTSASFQRDPKARDILEHWPRPGQQLFRDDAHWTETAVLERTKDWFGYVTSFREAATLIYEGSSTLSKNPSAKDVLFIPFAFLWRHYAELSLKASIILLSEYLNHPLDRKKMCTTHSLAVLWDQFYELDVAALPVNDAEDLRYAAKTIAQLQKVDATSMQFRYPVDKNGNPHLSNTNKVGMTNFHNVMLGFADWMEGGFDYIDYLMYEAPENES